METAHDILTALARRFSFGEVAALVAAGAGGDSLTTRAAAQVQQLCAFGQRLLDLDAEDFGVADAAAGANTDTSVADRMSADAVPSPLRERALACRMPQTAQEHHRGALGSLRPAYALLLEVIEARWRRRETTALVATVHIASEYAPLLAWEPVLGHAGDPARLAAAVGGAGSAWGDFDDPACPHTRPEKSAAKHALRVAEESPTGWQSYLDRQHSNTAHALAVCAAKCQRPCTVVTRLSPRDEARVAGSSRLALAFADSAIVRLRHSAPVGHGFGVPSPAEVTDAWQHSRDSLGRLDRAVRTDDGFSLPGLPSLFTAMSGVAIAPGTLLADTGETIASALSD